METPTLPSERFRLRVPLPAERIAGAGARPRFLGYVSEVSETGLFVQCTNPGEVGTVLTVRVRMPGRHGEVVCGGAEIVWTRGYQGTHGASSGMGLRLVRMDEPAREVWRGLCVALERGEIP